MIPQDGTKRAFALIAVALIATYLSINQAQAVWTKSESARVKTLELRVQELEAKLQNSNATSKRSIQFLAIRGNGLRVCPGDSYPIFSFPFNAGQGYYIPARMSDYGNFNEAIQLITCAIDIVEPK
jgi:hypothetical protein